ncbi:MAG: hypothetical protein HZA54_03155 [Planctomycetes bacterium]|nr:hypothetical protein [Planctomycetota bacterium]
MVGELVWRTFSSELLLSIGLCVATAGVIAAGVRIGVALFEESRFGLLELLASGLMVSACTLWAASTLRCRYCPPPRVLIACLGFLATLPVAAGAAWGLQVGRKWGCDGLGARLLLLLYGWSLTVPGAALLVVARVAGELPFGLSWDLIGVLSLPLLLQLWVLPAFLIERGFRAPGRHFALDAHPAVRYPPAPAPGPPPVPAGRGFMYFP